MAKLILRMSFLLVVALFVSCKGDGKKADETQSAPATTNSQPAQAAPSSQVPSNFTPSQGPPPSTPQNAKGVWHFTCPKGCEGGAGEAVACAKCGTTLTHNQNYHQ
ncbi:MAG: hypothetical protein WAT21_14605 [Saprospiraceae bacterium]